MEHDDVAFAEQTMRYGRPNVPDATDEHPHSLRLHRQIVQQRRITSDRDTGTSTLERGR
jgi:hypothetical protein